MRTKDYDKHLLKPCPPICGGESTLANDHRKKPKKEKKRNGLGLDTASRGKSEGRILLSGHPLIRDRREEGKKLPPQILRNPRISRGGAKPRVMESKKKEYLFCGGQPRPTRTGRPPEKRDVELFIALEGKCQSGPSAGSKRRGRPTHPSRARRKVASFVP